jgi:iron complex outermembrane receptor protein
MTMRRNCYVRSAAKCYRVALLAAVSVLAVHSAPAAAQNDTQQEEAQSQDGLSVDTIVVTARRFEENVQNAPIAITAVTGEGLEIRDVDDVAGLTEIAPNVTISSGNFSGNGSAAVAFIRGIGQIDFTLTTDPGVGIYVDGVYYARAVGSVLDLFDVKRVEVLRGPQGTLFGRNSTGGAISIFTKDPPRDFGASGRIIVGGDDRYEGFASVGGMVSDTLGIIASGLIRRQDGVAVDASGRDLGDDHMQGARAKAVWKATDSFELTLAGDYVSEQEGSAPEVPLVRAADGSVDNTKTKFYFSPATAAMGESGTRSEAWGVSLTADAAVSDVVSVKLITAHRSLDSLFHRQPSPLTSRFYSTDPYDHRQFSGELQATAKLERFQLVAGAFYMSEHGSNLGIVDVGAAPTGFPRLIGTEIDNENWAVFGEATVSLTDRLRVIGGLRYTDETKGARFTSQSIPGVTRGTTSASPVISTIGFNPDQELNFNKATYRGVVQYDVSDQLNFYGSYSTGFKSGGFNPRLVGALVSGFFKEPDIFLPESVATAEAGLKFQNRNLRLNVAAFHTDYTNIQISGAPPGQIATQTFNGAKAKVDGLEVEMNWAATPALLLDASLGLMDARYTSINANSAEVTLKDKFVFTPPYTLGLGATHLLSLGSAGEVRSHVGAFRSGRVHFEPSNAIATFEDGYTTVDASITYLSPGEEWKLTFGVNNLTDERYLVAGDANVSLAYDIGQFARRRNWYLKLAAEF